MQSNGTQTGLSPLLKNSLFLLFHNINNKKVPKTATQDTHFKIITMDNLSLKYIFWYCFLHKDEKALDTQFSDFEQEQDIMEILVVFLKDIEKIRSYCIMMQVRKEHKAGFITQAFILLYISSTLLSFPFFFSFQLIKALRYLSKGCPINPCMGHLTFAKKKKKSTGSLEFLCRHAVFIQNATRIQKSEPVQKHDITSGKNFPSQQRNFGFLY